MLRLVLAKSCYSMSLVISDKSRYCKQLQILANCKGFFHNKPPEACNFICCSGKIILSIYYDINLFMISTYLRSMANIYIL